MSLRGDIARLRASLDGLRVPDTLGRLSLGMPNIMEFVFLPEYLGKFVYPRQATLLKIIFLAVELMTQFDHDVIGEWTDEFTRTGCHGIQPDIYERIQMCRAEGRLWFREVVLPIGRRGSKGFVGALAGSYVLYWFTALEDPQRHFGFDPNKRLTAMIFGAKKEQAKANLWGDLAGMILESACFNIGVSTTDSLTVRCAADERRAAALRNRGVTTHMDMSSFEILAKESTATAGRGPASFLMMFDEMAHVTTSGGSARSAEDVYESAVPSLDQFGTSAFIYAPSSPWHKTGKFFELYEQALEQDDQGRPVYPEKFMAQLHSFDLYDDYQLTWSGDLRLIP